MASYEDRYKERIVEQYEKEMMEAIKDVPQFGHLDYNISNGFTFLSVSFDFAFKCQDI